MTEENSISSAHEHEVLIEFILKYSHSIKYESFTTSNKKKLRNLNRLISVLLWSYPAFPMSHQAFHTFLKIIPPGNKDPHFLSTSSFVKEACLKSPELLGSNSYSLKFVISFFFLGVLYYRFFIFFILQILLTDKNNLAFLILNFWFWIQNFLF